MKENYHIAALGGGALVLAGLGYLGFSGNQAANEEFNASNPPKKADTGVPGKEILDHLMASVSELDSIDQRATKSDRPVDLFTSVDLYTRNDNKRELLDLLQMDKPVHPPIDNQWWIDHRIDPSFSDSPEKDQDGDGFTNLEEFQAKTDPNDAKSHGELITKLKVASVQSDRWLLLFQSVLGRGGYQFNLKYKAFGARPQANRISASDAVKIGSPFFKAEPQKGRFVLKDVEAREERGSTGVISRKWAIVEDQRANKKGQTYEIPFGLKVAKQNKEIRYDHTVVFSLNAIGEAANKFKVEENGTFSLPNGGEDLKYKLVEVKLGDKRKPIAVMVQVGDDTVNLHEIPVPQAVIE